MSARTLSRILIIGSSGTIGSHITTAFANARSKFERLAILTSQNTVENKKDFIGNLKEKKVDVIVGDIGDDSFVGKTFQEFDTVVSALGRNALHLQPHLVDILAGLPKLASGHPRRFYPSEYGTDIRYDPVTSPHEKPHQNKLSTRAHIEKIVSSDPSALEFTYVVTGPFLDTFLFASGGRPAGYDASAGTYSIVGPKDASQQRIISGTTYVDTGKYVLSSVLTPEASKNATLRVSSADSKPAELLEAIRKVAGKELEVKYKTLDDLREEEKRAWEEKNPSATVYTLTRIWYEGGSDFTRKPRALYFREGKEVEDEELEKQLFKDVPKPDLATVVSTLL